MQVLYKRERVHTSKYRLGIIMLFLLECCCQFISLTPKVHAAHEGGGLINSNNMIKGVIKCLFPVAFGMYPLQSNLYDIYAIHTALTYTVYVHVSKSSLTARGSTTVPDPQTHCLAILVYSQVSCYIAIPPQLYYSCKALQAAVFRRYQSKDSINAPILFSEP